MNKADFIILSFFFAALCVFPLQAQVAATITPEQFQSAVHTELAKHEGGEYLYSKSESYQRMIHFIVRKNLGLIRKHSAQTPPLTMSDDTSAVCDPYDNSDDQDETSVAINRGVKSIICIGANEDGDDGGMYSLGMPVFTSSDEGNSWNTYRLPMPPNVGGANSFMPLGDPIVISDDHGNFYYAYLAGDGSNSTGNICIATSQDGINWGNRTPLNINKNIPGSTDKEHLTIDCSLKSPHYGRVYLTWYEFYVNGLQTGEGLSVAWSDDKCKTWSKPVSLGEGDNFQEIKTNSKGDVLLAFSDRNTLGQELFVSTNGGQSFAKQAIKMNNRFSLFPLNRKGTQSLKGANGFRSFPYVAFDIDLSSDRIHAVYGNYELTGSSRNSVLYYVTSDNNGTSWSNPKMLGISNPLHSSPSFDRFHQWVSFDQNTGEAWAMYYSSEQDQSNILSAAYRTKLSDNLSDYPEMLHPLFDPTIVETTSSNSFPFIGDYSGSDAFDSVYVATWTENHPNAADGEVFAYISYPSLYPPSLRSVGNAVVVHSNKLWLSHPYPNPIGGSSFSLSYYLPHSSHIQLELIDAEGKIVKQLAEKNIATGTYTEEFTIGNIPKGTYFLQMISDDGQEMRKIIVQ